MKHLFITFNYFCLISLLLLFALLYVSESEKLGPFERKIEFAQSTHHRHHIIHQHIEKDEYHTPHTLPKMMKGKGIVFDECGVMSRLNLNCHCLTHLHEFHTPPPPPPS